MTRTRNTNFRQNHRENKELLIPSNLLSFLLPLQHLCLSIAQDLYVLPFFFRKMCCQEGTSGSFRHTACLLFYGKSICRCLPICLVWGPASHGKAPEVVVFCPHLTLSQVLSSSQFMFVDTSRLLPARSVSICLICIFTRRKDLVLYRDLLNVRNIWLYKVKQCQSEFNPLQIHSLEHSIQLS